MGNLKEQRVDFPAKTQGPREVRTSSGIEAAWTHGSLSKGQRLILRERQFVDCNLA